MARTDTETRKKAGGTGKKGQVFMEDKVGQLVNPAFSEVSCEGRDPGPVRSDM